LPLTDEMYPTERKWILKAMVPRLIVATIIVAFPIIFGRNGILVLSSNGLVETISVREVALVVLAGLILSIFLLSSQRTRFHYSIEKAGIILKWGATPTQTRTIRYTSVGSVSVVQNVFDKLFGLASVRIFGARGADWITSYLLASGLRVSDASGIIGNVINIPGLTKANAEIVKAGILDRVKNPI